MARQTLVRLIDDLDGSAADSSVQFGLDGVGYSIDLSTEHETELRGALAPYLEVAHKIRPAGSKSRGRDRAAPDKDRNTAIRAWALSEGVELAQRGRIAKVVQQAYDAQDGDLLRESLGLELVEEKPARRRRATTQAHFSAAE